MKIFMEKKNFILNIKKIYSSSGLEAKANIYKNAGEVVPKELSELSYETIFLQFKEINGIKQIHRGTTMSWKKNDRIIIGLHEFYKPFTWEPLKSINPIYQTIYNVAYRYVH